MEDFIAIKSNSINIREGKLLMNKDKFGNLNFPGRMLKEGENPENVCESELLDSKIIRPLHPKISWKKINEEIIPMVSLNYLTKVQNV